jgi:hypothetical protein
MYFKDEVQFWRVDRQPGNFIIFLAMQLQLRHQSGKHDMLMENPKRDYVLHAYARGLKLNSNADQFSNYIMAGRASFSAVEYFRLFKINYVM